MSRRVPFSVRPIAVLMSLLVVGGCGRRTTEPTPDPEPLVTFAFSPNPAHSNPQDPHCNAIDFYCWTFGTTIRETGGARLTVTSWQIRHYDPALVQQPLVFTFTANDFRAFFGDHVLQPSGSLTAGEVRTPGQPISGGIIVWFQTPAGGSLDIVVTGQDAQGRSFTFTSGRMNLVP